MIASLAAAITSYGANSIQDVDYQVVDTEIEQSTLPGWGILGVWIDDNRIVINAIERDKASGGERRKAFLYDVHAQSLLPFVIENGRVRCLEIDGGFMGVEIHGQTRLMKFVPPGTLQRLDQASSLSPFSCRPTEPRHPGRLQTFLRQGDGYIDRGPAGKGGLNSEFAVLHRPGHPSSELPILGREINTAQYVPFLNKYLLNDNDPRMLQEPDRPYRLITPDGKVSEIPYPAHLKNALKLHFAQVVVLQRGLLAVRTGPGSGEAGFFLIEGEQILRFWGKNKDSASRVTPSPDGCKIAFLSWRAEENLKTVKVINTCPGGK